MVQQAAWHGPCAAVGGAADGDQQVTLRDAEPDSDLKMPPYRSLHIVWLHLIVGAAALFDI